MTKTTIRFVMAAAAAPNQCGGCAATVGNCVRVSCSPCCHKCPGFPYLICLQY